MYYLYHSESFKKLKYSIDKNTKYIFVYTDLLHVTKYILTTVKNAFAFLRVQIEDEICCVVCITFLIPGGTQFDVII